MIEEITVLMSVYNGEKYLREALDSVLNQTFKNFEFLIINDGSTDKTERILKSYNDPRIKIVNNKKNIGLTKSLNKGLKLAKGKYVARMDADDISLPERLKIQLKFMEENGKFGLVGSWATLIDKKGVPLEVWQTNYYPEDIFYMLNFRNCLTHSSTMFRKDLVLDLGGYNEKILRSQDYDLWQRLSKKGKIYLIKKCLIKLRRTPFNISSKFNNEQQETVFKIVKQNLELLTGLRFSRKQIEILQSNKVESEYDLEQTLNELNEINKAILEKQKQVIHDLSLNKKTLKKTMQTRKYNLIKDYFKKNRDRGKLLFKLLTQKLKTIF